MEFKITIKGKLSAWFIRSSHTSVYYALVELFGHETAASAEGWCELASIGEHYEDNGFEIEVVER